MPAEQSPTDIVLCDKAELQRRYYNHLQFLKVLRASNIDSVQVERWANQIQMFFLEHLPEKPSARL